MIEKLPQGHQDLVQKLTQDLKPVKKARPARSFQIWFIASLSLVIGCVILLGLRKDLNQEIFGFMFSFTNIALLIGALLSSWIAIKLSIPGEEFSKITLIIVTAIPLVLVMVITAESLINHGWTNYVAGFDNGIQCTLATFLVALIPLTLLTIFTSRFAPLHPFATAFFVSLASLCLSGMGVQWHCYATKACHLATWHYAPIFVISIVISYPLQLILSRWRTS